MPVPSMSFWLQLEEELDTARAAIAPRRAFATDVAEGMVRIKELGAPAESPEPLPQLLPRGVQTGDAVLVINLPGRGSRTAAPTPVVLGAIGTGEDAFVGLVAPPGFDALPAPSEGYRGQLITVQDDDNGDALYVCLLAADGNYAWVALAKPLTGGTSS